MSYLQLNHVSVAYGRQRIIEDCSLTLEKGETLTLLGASGSGKSTLLKALAGLMPLAAGDIYLDGRRLNDVPPQERQMGMIFQDYALFPHWNVADNIRFGLHHLPRQQQNQTIEEMLHLVRLEALAGRYPHQLSGGQQQRIALARALARQPALLLLDEAFSNLDEQVRQHLLDEMRPLLRTRQITAIAVTHHHQEAYALAHRIAVLHQGRLLACGRPEQMYTHPAAEVASLLGRTVVLEAPHPLLPPGMKRLVLRPQHFIWEKINADDAPVRVENVWFYGDDWLHELRFSDGSLLQLPQRERHPPGQGLRLRLALPESAS